jgi:hypothetical protein
MLERCAAPGRRVVYLNLDETCLRLRPSVGAGHVADEARRLLRSAGGLRRPTTKRLERGTVSQIVVISADPDVQRALPTILVVSAAAMPLALWRRLLHRLPDGVLLLRETTAWTTAASMCRITRLLAQILRPWSHTCFFILTADTYRAHISPSVWNATCRAGFGYMMIPARMTWALQPLDTHAFARYKRSLAAECQAVALSRGGEGSPGDPEEWEHWLDAVVRAWTTCVRDRDWGRAFASNGLGAPITAVSERVRGLLGNPSWPPDTIDALPELTDFLSVFPGRTRIPIEGMFRIAASPAGLQPAETPSRASGRGGPSTASGSAPTTRPSENRYVAPSAPAWSPPPAPPWPTPVPRRLPRGLRLGVAPAPGPLTRARARALRPPAPAVPMPPPPPAPRPGRTAPPLPPLSWSGTSSSTTSKS